MHQNSNTQSSRQPAFPRWKRIHVFLLALILSGGMKLSYAQTLEFGSSSAAIVNALPATTPKTFTFLLNTDNPTGSTFSAFTPTTTATFSIENQQFTKIQGTALTPGLSMGGAIPSPASSSDDPVASNDVIAIGSLGNPLSSYFSSTSANLDTGISLTNNYAARFATFCDALIDSVTYNNLYPVDATNIYYGDIVITFNQPVSNPVIHLGGLGGSVSTSSGSNNWFLGFSARVTLDPASGYTLTKLSGSPYFDVTGNVVSNTAVHKGSNTQGTTSNSSITTPWLCYAASGSVIVNGTNITSLRFKVAIDGDGGYASGTFTMSNVRWTNVPVGLNGDAFTVSVSIPNTTPLPLQLVDFSGAIRNSKAVLSWKTALEDDLKDFEVEMSNDADLFYSVGTVQARGNAGQYQFEKDQLPEGTYFFRLKMNHKDGTFTYSRVLSLHASDFNTQDISVYPNPADNMINISLPLKTDNGKATLFDHLGTAIKVLEIQNATQLFQMDVTTLAPGIYYLEVATQSNRYIKKIVKL